MDGIRIQIPEHVVSEPLDGEAVVLNLKTGQYYGLNRTGTFIWRQIESDGDLAAVRAALTSKYSKDPEVLNADLAELLQELEHRGLIVLRSKETAP